MAQLVRRPTVPLSYAQERLWLAEVTTPGTAIYHIPVLLSWAGRVDVEALSTALRTVTERHEILRTTYEFGEDEPLQVIAAPAAVPVEVVDVSGTVQVAQRAQKPFDLATEWPLRCTVFRGSGADDLVLLCLHHIAVDGWSVDLLLAELREAYLAARSGVHPQLPDLPCQYADFALWERKTAQSQSTRRRLADRASQLRSVPRDLSLGPPTPEVRGPQRGGYHVFTVPEPLWTASRQLARSLRLTPFALLLAAFETVVWRSSGRTEFVLGTTMANRPRAEWHQLIGFFVNLVPLRCTVDPRESFADRCRRAGAEVLIALRHQDIPFQHLVAATAGGRPSGQSGLVQIGFGWRPAADASTTPAPWLRHSFIPTGTTKFDIDLLLHEDGHELLGTIEFDADRYPAPVVERLAEDLLEVLGEVRA